MADNISKYSIGPFYEAPQQWFGRMEGDELAKYFPSVAEYQKNNLMIGPKDYGAMFAGVTPEQYQNYFTAQDTQRNNMFNNWFGDKKPDWVTARMNEFPSIVNGPDGNPYVQYYENKRLKPDFFDKIDSAVGAGLSLSGFGLAGLGGAFSGLPEFFGNALSSGLQGLTGTGAGGLGALADVPWGVNALAGGVDEAGFLGELLGGGAGAAAGSLPPLAGQLASAGDWWTPLGLTAADVGQAAGAWTTNPAFAELVGGAGISAGGGSLLSSLASQLGTSPATLLRTLGTLGSTALGVYGANQQANSLEKLAQQYAGFGAPYRAELLNLTKNPSSFLSSDRAQVPVQMGTDALARSLSVQGNPAGSGRALQELQSYATNGLYSQLANRENQLANFGGLSQFNAAAPGLQTAAIGSNNNIYNALGSGLANLTNPTPSLSDLMKALGAPGLP